MRSVPPAVESVSPNRCESPPATAAIYRTPLEGYDRLIVDVRESAGSRPHCSNENAPLWIPEINDE